MKLIYLNVSIKKRKFQHISLLGMLIIFLLNLGSANADNGLVEGDLTRTDFRNFTTNTVVKVVLDAQSFTNAGFPATFSQTNLERAIRIAIDNWVQISGLRLRIRYDGLAAAGQTSANDRQILIRALSLDPTPGTPAAARASNASSVNSNTSRTNFSNITFHRNISVMNPFNWVMYSHESAGDNVFLGVLIHEIGHSLGLGHNDDNDIRTVMSGVTQSMLFSYGPYREDIEDVLDMYNNRNKLDIKVKRSTDQGLTWTGITSNITNSSATSTMPIAVNRDSDRMMMFYTTTNKKPAWRIGGTHATGWNNGTVFGGLRSIYGTVGHGFDGEYMMAWVDYNANVKVVRSTNGGSSWVFKNPPNQAGNNSRSTGTPAVNKLDNNTWILTYAKLDDLRQDIGQVVARISTNDGATWGPEVDMGTSGGNAIRGVTVTSDGPQDIKIGYAQATSDNISGTFAAGSRIVTRNAKIDSNGELKRKGAGSSTSRRTSNEPVFTRTSSKFIAAYRNETSGKIMSGNGDANSTAWLNIRTPVNSREVVGPALAARKNSAWVYMFYLDD